MNFPQFKGMPDAALKDLTDNTVNPDGSKKSENSVNPGNLGSSAGSENVFDTGTHTENKGNTNAGPVPGAAPNNTNTGQTSAGKLLGDKGAKFAIDLMNFAIPALIYLIISGQGYDTSKDQWKLDKDEREVVTPAVQAVLDRIMIDLDNPYMQLAVVLSIVYGAKTAVFMAEAKKKAPVSPLSKMPWFAPSPGPGKRSFEEIYEDELKDYINEYKTEKNMGFDKAKGLVTRNKNRMQIIEKKARGKFEAQ